MVGARRIAPLALSCLAFGVAFGVLARQTGLSPAEALLMSGLVLAGASQFVALELWAAPVPALPILLATLAVNARHLLMGAALRPWFAGLPAWQAYGALFFLSDGNWALTVRECEAGRRDGGFLLGGGLALAAAWIGGTAAGHALGEGLQDPGRWGLDFMLTAFFTALLVGKWRGKADVVPWAAAASAAVIAAQWLPAHWYILVGGLAGSLVGALHDGA